MPETQSAAQTPQVGETYEVTAYGKTWVATVINLPLEAPNLVCLDKSSNQAIDHRYGIDGWWVSREHLIRRVSPAASSDQPRFYMTQPSVLPETLPAGTKWNGGRNGKLPGNFTGAVALSEDSEQYVGEGVTSGTRPSYRYVDVEMIDWTTVPLQATASAPVEAFKPAESWHGFRKGERVTHKHWGCNGKVIGGGENYLLCERDDGKPDSTNMFPREAIRVSPAAAGGEPMCPGDGGYACSCEKCSKPRVTPPKPKTGYPNVGFVPFDQRASGIDAAIHLSKLEQAKALLARPIRTGPMRNRDKYGQKVSLKGWETDDE